MRIEHLTDKGKEINEDSYLIGKNLFGVFDGATGLIKYMDNRGNTGGLIASQTAKEVFANNSDKPFLSLTKQTLSEIKRKMTATNMDLTDKAGFWSTSASVVRINDHSIEYMRIGDSPILIIYKNGDLKTFYVDHDLETAVLWKKLVDEGVKEIRKDPRMQAQLLKNRRETNINYGMLNGEEDALRFVQTGSIPLDEIKNILILSDGALIPKQSPEDPEDFAKIVTLFEEGGLGGIKTYVRELENSDPDCVKYLRFKPHDDLTAIAIIP